MARLLPRFREEDEDGVEDAIAKAESSSPRPGVAGGDRRALRGIPVLASGVGGTSPGTSPGAQLERSSDRD